ncbi:MAG: endonuclease/exonuclease/phosphatase family protein [Bacteroidaceae bacterium]
MMKCRYILGMFLAALLLLTAGEAQARRRKARGGHDILRLLYWNIQNGMWDGQTDDYQRFTSWVDSLKPDVCVWCEAQSIWVTNSDKAMPKEERQLPARWPELAARYGHKYIYVAEHRDNYPQVITSRYPVENVLRMGGNADTLVAHGAGWARMCVGGQDINIVTLHTWPMGYAPKAADRTVSAAEHGGDRQRRMEVEYIYRHTLGSVPEGEKQFWLMMGDFNSRTSLDSYQHHIPAGDSRLCTQDFILEHTPYIDIIAYRHPKRFFATCGGSRIDFVYATRPAYDCVTDARVIRDAYTAQVRDPQKLSNFYHPSDHLPILVDFRLK